MLESIIFISFELFVSFLTEETWRSIVDIPCSYQKLFVIHNFHDCFISGNEFTKSIMKHCSFFGAQEHEVNQRQNSPVDENKSDDEGCDKSNPLVSHSVLEFPDLRLKLILKFNDLLKLLALVNVFIGKVGFILNQDIKDLMEILMLLITLKVSFAECFCVLELILIKFFALDLLLPDGHECLKVLYLNIEVWVVILFLCVQVRKRGDHSNCKQGDQSLQEQRHLLVLVQVVHFVDEIFH
jgi:hypothetical protein